MKATISLILLLLVSIQAFPQAEPSKRVVGLRLYNSIRYTSSATVQPSWQLTQRNWDILQPSVGIFWKGKGRSVREVELSNLSLGSARYIYQTRDSLTGQTGAAQLQNLVRESGLRCRAEALVPLMDKGDSPFKFSFGFGAVFAFSHFSSQPAVSNAFPFSSTKLSLNGSFTPRATYWVSERLALDLSLPLGLINFSFENQNEGDPGLPLTLRNTTNFAYDLFVRDYALRMGLALAL